MSSEAFVTLATTDVYALGALVLAESIRQVGTTRNLVVLISNHLSDLIRESLNTSFDEVIVVEELNSNDEEHLRLLNRPELGVTFTKINCWLLEQYTKCVFLDSDCIVQRSIDDLFEREELSAAPDAGWPDCFNSGVFVYRPSKETFRNLMNFASEQQASFDGGDQGLLNEYFSSWRTDDISRHLPFTYNVTANAFYSYLPAVTRFRNDIHVVHFAGALKPWQLTYNPQNEQLSGNLAGQNDIQRSFLLSWWKVFYERVWPKVSQFKQLFKSNNQSLFDRQVFGHEYLGSLGYDNSTHNQGIELGSVAHRRAWEAGQIDYFGRDSFSNIEQQLHKNIAHLPQQYNPAQQREITPEKTTTTTTSILKKPNQETTLPLQQSTNLPQDTSKAGTSASVSTQQVTNGTKHTMKETILPSTQTTNFHQNTLSESKPVPTLTHQGTNIAQSAMKETVLPSTQTTNLHENTLSGGKPVTTSTQPETNITPSAMKETILPATHATNFHQNTLNGSKPVSTSTQPETNITKSVMKETVLPSTQTTNLHENTLNGSKPVSTSTQQGTNITQSAMKETVVPATQATNFHQNTLNGSKSVPTSTHQGTNITQSAMKETVLPSAQTTNLRENTLSGGKPVPTSTQQVTNVTKSAIEQATTPLQQTTYPLKSSVKESTLAQPTISSLGNIQSSLHSTEHLTSTHPHESNWTVKSTIVTAYTPGVGTLAGPTVVSKVISEASASSSPDVPVHTSIKEKTDSGSLFDSNITVKTPNDHFAWLFDKLFLAITYTISLCYLVFLLTVRRSNNPRIIHDNGTSIRAGTSTSTTTMTTNGNRVKK